MNPLTQVQQEYVANTYGYHSPKTQEQRDQITASRRLFANTASELLRMLPEGDAKTAAMACLEYASFNANAAIARAWGPAEPFWT